MLHPVLHGDLGWAGSSSSPASTELSTKWRTRFDPTAKEFPGAAQRVQGRLFNHFDKSKTGRLNPEEFKNCLISLGYMVGQDKQGEIDSADPVHRGPNTPPAMCSLTVFLDFMTRESTDVDTAEAGD